jgi:hypothetical protein
MNPLASRRPAYVAALVMLMIVGLGGIARAQSFEISSIFEVDPTLALNGFAVFSGAIVLLFEACRSRP